mgnify:CR=1 FL=1
MTTLPLRRALRERAGKSIVAQMAGAHLRFVLREISLRGETPERLRDLHAAQVNYERALAR